jgi:hypothetical protein
MQKIILLLCLCSSNVFGQFKNDTVIVKSSWYGRVMPYSLYAGPGKIADRVSQNIELGRSFGVIDLGLSYGRISQRPDSTSFLEAKITMDACQYGIFSNEFTVGAGRVFNSNTPIMLEVASTVYAQLGKNWGVGIVTGYYDFSGETHGSNKNYFGVFLRYGLLRNDGGVLMNRRVRVHHHHL